MNINLKKEGRISQIITIIGLVISLSGNVIQWNSIQTNSERNKILREQKEELQTEIENRDMAFTRKVRSIENMIERLERQNEDLNARLNDGSIESRFNKLAQIQRNDAEIIRLREKISDITY